MPVSRFPTPKRPVAMTTECTLFTKYENGRVRRYKFDVNALADFEEKTGMGFAQLMQQKAIFASARAMLWAGLKSDDRTLSVEDVGLLMSDYLRDENVPSGEHSIDTLLTDAIAAAVEHGALGRRQEEPTVEEPQAQLGGSVPNDLVGEKVEGS